MGQNTQTCKGLKMWNYVSIISLGIDKILLYLDLTHIMYIFSNFALCKVPNIYCILNYSPSGYIDVKCTLLVIFL